MRVAIVVRKDVENPEALVLSEQLRRQGCQAQIFTDGDRSVLGVDAIIAYGYPATLSGLRRLIRKTAPEKRPVVTTILREPLIPLNLPKWCDVLGLRFTSVHFGFHGGNKLMLRLFRPVFWLIATFGMRKFRLSNTAKEVQFVFEQSAWIKLAHKEGWLRSAAASTLQKCDVLKAWGIPTAFVPHSMFFDPESEPPRDGIRDLDVLFLGRLSNSRRILALKRIVSDLERRGLTVETHFHGMYGEKRTRLLQRTRVMIHLPKYRWDTPWIRWYLGSQEGVALVSETVSQPEPFRPGSDYFETSLEKLADLVEEVCKDETRRKEVAETCRQRISTEFNYLRAIEGFYNDLLLGAVGGSEKS